MRGYDGIWACLEIDKLRIATYLNREDYLLLNLGCTCLYPILDKVIILSLFQVDDVTILKL